MSAEEPINPEVVHYYSINFLVIEETPAAPSTTATMTTAEAKTAGSSGGMEERAINRGSTLKSSFRMSPTKMDTAQDGYQYRIRTALPLGRRIVLQQLRWTFAAEGNGRRRCITDVSNPSALSNLTMRKAREDGDSLQVGDVSKAVSNGNGGKKGSQDEGNAPKRPTPSPNPNKKRGTSTPHSGNKGSSSVGTTTTTMFPTGMAGNPRTTNNDAREASVQRLVAAVAARSDLQVPVLRHRIPKLPTSTPFR